MVGYSFTNLVAVGLKSVAVTQTSDTAHVSSKELLGIKASIEGCLFRAKSSLTFRYL